MAINKDALNKKLHGVATELKDDVKQDALKREEEAQNLTRSSKGQAAAEEARQAEKERIREEYMKAWDDFIQEARHLSQAKRHGADTFESAMHEILSACISMNKALSLSMYPNDQFTVKNVKKHTYNAAHAAYKGAAYVGGKFDVLGVGKPLKNGAELLVNSLGNVPQALHDYYEKRVQDSKKIEPASPTTIFSVDENGVFKLNEFKLDNGKPLSSHQQDVLKEAISLWLLEANHCKLDVDNKVYKLAVDGNFELENGSKIQVTNEELIKLRDDPGKGIGAYFKQHYLDVRMDISSPRPS